MKEIRIHGRGGQGAVVASNILAAAAYKDGNFVQSFPAFGSERRGAPVRAFIRIDNKPITLRQPIYEPDGVIVLDETLIGLGLEDVTSGLKSDGFVLINTRKRPVDFETLKSFKVFTVDANAIAIRNGLGTVTTPIVSTAILGAFSAATKLVSLESIVEAVKEEVPSNPEGNVKAVKEAFKEVVMS